jgi:hypothetical protein
LARRTFDETPARLAEGHDRALWIPRVQIGSADLRRGLLNSRLSLQMVDGRKVKLLWLKSDEQAFDALKAVLHEWLGSDGSDMAVVLSSGQG